MKRFLMALLTAALMWPAAASAETKELKVALVLFICGFSLYCFAIAQLLIAARPH